MRIGIVAMMATMAACSTLPDARAQPHCANWNSYSFFKTAGAEDVRACLRARADPDARTESGLTPLHVAAFMDHAAAVAAPLKAGADSGARGKKFGATPLHAAALFGRVDAVAVLLKAGADPGARDKDGLTLFDLIPEDSPLIGTPVYRRLNDASRK